MFSACKTRTVTQESAYSDRIIIFIQEKSSHFLHESVKKLKEHPASFPTDVCRERTALAGFLLQPESLTVPIPGLYKGILFLHLSAVLMLSSCIRQQSVGKV